MRKTLTALSIALALTSGQAVASVSDYNNTVSALNSVLGLDLPQAVEGQESVRLPDTLQPDAISALQDILAANDDAELTTAVAKLAAQYAENTDLIGALASATGTVITINSGIVSVSKGTASASLAVAGGGAGGTTATTINTTSTPPSGGGGGGAGTASQN